MDLQIRTQTVGASPAWLDSTETLRFVRDGVTINAAAVTAVDGKKIVKSGTPIVKNGTKWEPSFGATNKPTAILFDTLDVTDGDKHGGALDHGRVRQARLPVTVHADAVAALGAAGITVV
jgi:hypothetical protein